MADKVMIHVDQLRKDYGSGRHAVDDISFDVRAARCSASSDRTAPARPPP